MTSPGDVEPDPVPPLSVYAYPDPIPAAVQRRWSRLDADRAVLWDLLVFLLKSFAVIAAAAGVGALAFGDGPGWTAVTLILIAFVVAVVATMLQRRLLRTQRLLRPREMDLLLDHRIEIAAADWGLGSDPATWPEEAVLAARSQSLARQIVGSTAWRDDVLEHHRAQLDPAEDAREIAVAAWHLQQLRAELGPPPTGRGPLAEQVASEWTAVHDELERDLHTTRLRVAALRQYAEAVDGLAEPVANRAALERLRRLPETRLPAVMHEDARQQLATDRLIELSEQVSRIGSELLGEPPSGERIGP